MCKKMNVKMTALDMPISNLSGGNQQKVILAKWMICSPDILIVYEPTRGIDVGAKNEIYELMISLVKDKKGIVMVSSELPELIGICDRIYVVSEGRITGMVEKNNYSQEKIMKLAVNAV
jgi:inositol transport system ATP-binding protein